MAVRPAGEDRPRSAGVARAEDADRTRLHSLDALRGVAALAVVFWHWQHFWFRDGAIAAGWDRQAQPLYPVFFLFYNRGDLAVDLFFTLSGFIFFRLYADRIAQRRVSARDFTVLRLSRLYPLHLVTLLAVALGQAAHTALRGESFVYRYNDLPHFVLNLLMLPAAGLERGFSFNGPAWSVSVECMLYAVFFVLCRRRWTRPVHLLALVAAGLFVAARVHPLIGRGLTSFFVGGLAYHAWLAVRGHAQALAITRATLALTVALWLAAIVVARADLSWEALAGVTHVPVPLLARFAVLMLFPLTLLTLALVEPGAGGFFRRLGPLGDISYSSYLWHFPVQLLFVLGAGAAGLGSDTFRSVWVLAAFATVLLGGSVLSYRFLEMPAQRGLRRRWLSAAGRGA